MDNKRLQCIDYENELLFRYAEIKKNINPSVYAKALGDIFSSLLILRADMNLSGDILEYSPVRNGEKRSFYCNINTIADDNAKYCISLIREECYKLGDYVEPVSPVEENHPDDENVPDSQETEIKNETEVSEPSAEKNEIENNEQADNEPETAHPRYIGTTPYLTEQDDVIFGDGKMESSLLWMTSLSYKIHQAGVVSSQTYLFNVYPLEICANRVPARILCVVSDGRGYKYFYPEKNAPTLTVKYNDVIFYITARFISNKFKVQISLATHDYESFGDPEIETELSGQFILEHYGVKRCIHNKVYQFFPLSPLNNDETGCVNTVYIEMDGNNILSAGMIDSSNSVIEDTEILTYWEPDEKTGRDVFYVKTAKEFI